MAHVRGRRSCLVKVDFDFSLVKSEVQVALYRLAYPYDFGVRFTILWAILRPYDCCQFPYDSANLRYFRKVCSSVYYRSYRHFRLLKKTMSKRQNFDNKPKIDLKC
jgi:hypothetical protein